MNPLENILVDVDATATAHPALERAVQLAMRSGARLTVAHVATVPPHATHYARLEEVVGELRQRLANIANAVRGAPAESKLLIGRPATVLIQEVLRAKHDLLIRSHARDLSAAGPKQFGVVDMELLRQCPCPVLLVRHGAPAPQPRIVAAVNASTEDAHEDALNTKIVEAALRMARYLEARSTRILHAWMPFAEKTMRGHSTDEQMAAYVESARARADADLARLERAFDGRLMGTPPVLRRGEPDVVIPDFVVAEGIDLVVMGTVARAGIAGMLLGNTAERILRKLPCSVLTVKPDGFTSPVRLDAS
ncbi:MAG: universal stress protein [Gemmatimonadales bacterium]